MGSSIVTTSVAGTIVQRGHFGRGIQIFDATHQQELRFGWAARKARHAGSVIAGPWSPPMQSTAMRKGGVSLIG